MKGQGRNLGRVLGTQTRGWGSRVKPLSLKKELEKQRKTVAVQTKIFQQIINIKNQEQNHRLQNGSKPLSLSCTTMSLTQPGTKSICKFMVSGL